MRKLLVMTVDTEVDKSSDWSVSSQASFNSVLRGIPELLEPLLRRHGAKCTYLISGEVLEKRECVDALRSLDDAELGTHLHGELVRPTAEGMRTAGCRFDLMQCSYSLEQERERMEALTELFRDSFGIAPRSFRAGRFGAGPNTARVLLELGYRVDTSITPGMDWDLPEGRADHTLAPHQPYYADERDLRKVGTSDLLEVPVTVRTNIVRRVLHSASSSMLLRKTNSALAKTLPAVWFRPSYHSGPRMIAAGEHELKRCRGMNTSVLNMMFHSMEIEPGASPYAGTDADVRTLLGRIDAALDWARRQDFDFVTLSELPGMIG